MSSIKELLEHRDDLARRIAADHEAADFYATKSIEHRRSAEIGQAELSGIERAIAAYRESNADRIVSSSVACVETVED